MATKFSFEGDANKYTKETFASFVDVGFRRVSYGVSRLQ